MARAGPSRWGEVETRACPLRQLQETHTGGSGCFRIYRPSSVIASHLGRCDSRHRFTLRYPMIFWTPRNRDVQSPNGMRDGPRSVVSAGPESKIFGAE